MGRSASSIACAAIAAALALALTNCGGGDQGETPEKSDTAPKQQPAKTGGKLSVLWANDVDLIDCGASYYQVGWMLCWSTQRPLYNYKPDEGAKMVADLAESDPQVSSDGQTVTVKIRPASSSHPR